MDRFIKNFDFIRTDIPDPPHKSWFPNENAGLLESPNRPLGKSSHVAALFNSPRPASSVMVIVDKPLIADVAAVIGDTISSDPSPSGSGSVVTPGLS